MIPSNKDGAASKRSRSTVSVEASRKQSSRLNPANNLTAELFQQDAAAPIGVLQQSHPAALEVDASREQSSRLSPTKHLMADLIPQDADAAIDLLRQPHQAIQDDPSGFPAQEIEHQPKQDTQGDHHAATASASEPLERQSAGSQHNHNVPRDASGIASCPHNTPTHPAATSKALLIADGPTVPSNGNRARFMSGLQPSKVSCDLTTAPVSPGLRFSFEAIIAVVYPASASPPERRYIEVMDQYGSTGITVWNHNAHVVGRDSVGCVVKFTRLALTMHNGKKNLTMAKDSTMHVEAPTNDGMLMKWWKSLLTEPIINCIQFHDTPALSVVNISGILGSIHVEEKVVKGETKNLLVLILTDRTGKMELRSWNHSDTEFTRFRERAVVFKRVRVCMFAGTRTGELLTGPNGTMISTDFDHADLDKYWSE